MCGFLGEFVFEGELSSKEAFANLLELSKQRGPDSTEITSKERFQLGFNRLAILDVSTNGNQPKQSPSGRYHVVFNGELYNYNILSETYKLKHLISTSDTEVLVHLLDLLGIHETVSLIRGMFAIAIIDTQSDCISLIRDYAGIKPLYYGLNEEGLVFASQFDQVFKHPWFYRNLELRPEVIKDYFAFGYMQAPQTIYSTIHQVEPGEIISIKFTGEITRELFCAYSPKPSTVYEENNATTQALDVVLKEVVKQQLVSDVSVGTFLSGGIDSPLVTAYAKSNAPEIDAFTIKIDDPILNESKIAQQYAGHLQIKHSIVEVTKSDLISNINDHFKGFSEPFGDYSSIPTYMLAKKAKLKHKVLLSGDGGDELFFGYERMLDILDKRAWFYIPKSIRKPLIRLTNALKITNTWAPFFDSFNDFVMSKHQYLSNDTLNIFFPTQPYSKAMQSLYAGKMQLSNANLLNYLRWQEFYGHLQRVLIKVDRASMAHGVEVRVPLLDKAVIDFAWALHSGLGKKHRLLKKTLKDCLKLHVPKELIETKKRGFDAPIYDWLQHDLKEDVYKHVFELPIYGQEHIKINAMKAFVSDFYNKKHHNAWGVWHVYAWQKWAYTHLDFNFYMEGYKD